MFKKVLLGAAFSILTVNAGIPWSAPTSATDSDDDNTPPASPRMRGFNEEVLQPAPVVVREQPCPPARITTESESWRIKTQPKAEPQKVKPMPRKQNRRGKHHHRGVNAPGKKQWHR